MYHVLDAQPPPKFELALRTKGYSLVTAVVYMIYSQSCADYHSHLRLENVKRGHRVGWKRETYLAAFSAEMAGNLVFVPTVTYVPSDASAGSKSEGQQPSLALILMETDRDGT